MSPITLDASILAVKGHGQKRIITLMNEALNTRICSSSEDYERAILFRQKQFFDERGIQDPYVWTMGHKDHEHFLLEKHGIAIGYAHIQYWIDNRAALRIIVVDKKEQGNGYGSYLMNFCEQVLKKKGIHVLQTESHQSAVHFYQRLGYVDMPFNDPDGHPIDENDTPLGKILK